MSLGMTILNRVLRTLLAVLVFGITGFVVAQVCAVPGIDGNATTGGILNTYYRPANGTYSSGSIALNNAAGISPIGAANTLAPNQLIAIVQMQCANINATDTDSYGDGVAGGVDANGGGSATAGRGYAGGYTEPAASCLAGQYEYFRTGPSTTATSIDLTGVTLIGTYVQAAATATTGKRTFQLVRIPQYASLTLNLAVTASPWNGFTGGVVMLDVAQQLNWAGFGVNVQGLGFRGGVWNANGVNGSAAVAGATDDRSAATLATLPSARGAVFPFRAPRDAATAASGGYTTVTNANVVRGGGKGEGIAGTPANLANGDGYPSGDRSSGAPGNAGGGGSTIQDCCRDNGGGGGGGNGGIGGRGGTGWAQSGAGPALPNWSNGELYGYGGAPFAQAATTRLVMGGGGGAGQTNDTLTAGVARGGNGGGMVVIRADNYTGGTASTIINARGEGAPNNTGNDAGGGGGAAGSILLIAYQTGGAVGTVTYEAIGGNGANSNTGGTGAHGPGGGGAGGVIFTTGTPPGAAQVAGGVTGVTPTPTSDGAADARHGARSATGFTGGAGSVTPPSNTCNPRVIKQYSPNPIPVNGTSTLTITLVNPANVDATLQQPFSDSITAPVSITTATTAAAPVVTTGTGAATCANTGVVVTGNGSLGFPNAYVIPANRSCALSVQVTSATVGAHLNTVPDGTLAGGLRTVLATSPIVFNASSTQDTLLVLDPTKSVVLQTDTAPTGASPNDTLRYTLTYSLPAGAATITNFQIWDILPAQVTKVGAAGTNVVVTPTGGAIAAVNGNYTGVAGATTSSLLAAGASLPAGGQIVVTIDATINTGITAGTNIDNLARAEGSGLPAVTGNGLAGGIATDARNTAAANNITQATNTTPNDPTRVTTVLAPPTLSKAFNPLHIVPGQTSLLTITIGNSNTSTLTLSQALTDNLPVGVTTTATVPTTTCTGSGAVTTTASSVTLPATRTIPAGGCILTVEVTSSTPGLYTNTIPAGNLGTGLGLFTNAGAAPAASAPLTVLEPTKTVRLLTDADGSGTPTTNDTVQYQIVYSLPSGAPPITNFQIFDVLPSQVTYTASATSPVITLAGGQTGTTAGTAYLGTNATATSAALLAAPVTLIAGGTITVTINAVINNTAVAGIPFDNTARASGTGLAAITGNGTGGGLASDADATPFGAPPTALPQPNDTATTGQATQVTPAIPPQIAVTKSAGTPIALTALSFRIPYTVRVANTGGAALNNAQANDILGLGANTPYNGASSVTVSSAPSVVNANGATCQANAGYTGQGANTALLSTTTASTLPNFGGTASSCTITFTVDVVYPNAAAIPIAPN